MRADDFRHRDRRFGLGFSRRDYRYSPCASPLRSRSTARLGRPCRVQIADLQCSPATCRPVHRLVFSPLGFAESRVTRSGGNCANTIATTVIIGKLRTGNGGMLLLPSRKVQRRTLVVVRLKHEKQVFPCSVHENCHTRNGCNSSLSGERPIRMLTRLEGSKRVELGRGGALPAESSAK